MATSEASASLQAKRLELLAAERAGNLRQLLLGASRTLNVMVVERLRKRGHTSFRSTHLGLTSHIDFEGTRLNVLASRANMTKQAMWELANELEKLGYVERRVDEDDRRNRIIAFTDCGWKLKLDNIEVFREIEAELEAAVGSRSYGALRGTLRALAVLRDEDPATPKKAALAGASRKRKDTV